MDSDEYRTLESITPSVHQLVAFETLEPFRTWVSILLTWVSSNVQTCWIFVNTQVREIPASLMTVTVGDEKNLDVLQHSSPSVQVPTDDVILVTAGYDHSIRIWQACSGVCLRTMQHPDSVSVWVHFLVFPLLFKIYISNQSLLTSSKLTTWRSCRGISWSQPPVSARAVSLITIGSWNFRFFSTEDLFLQCSKSTQGSSISVCTTSTRTTPTQSWITKASAKTWLL